MKHTIYFSILLSALASNAIAEETRQVDKHEHGVGELNIAIDKNIMDFEFMIPGADIVGFEYEAKSEQDVALVNNALSKFDDFNNVFTIPSNAQCKLGFSEVKINQEEEHDDHDEHDEHDEHDDHDEHDEHDDHDEHDEEVHNEFYAKYSFECGNIKAINEIEFPYFTTFPNSGELEVQFISELGSTSFEVEADEPSINTEGKI